MRTLERANTAVANITNLLKQARSIPGEATKASLARKQHSIEMLLSEEHELADVQGMLERIRPLVLTWVSTGVPDELVRTKNLRAMCYFLDKTELMNPTLLASAKGLAAIDLVSEHWTNSILSPLLLVYLRHCQDTGPELEAVLHIQEFLKTRLPRYSGSRKALKSILLFREYILDAIAPKSLAIRVATSGQNWNDFCNEMGLNLFRTTTYLGVAFLEYLQAIQDPTAYLEAETYSTIDAAGSSDVKRIASAIIANRCAQLVDKKDRLTSLLFINIGDLNNLSRWAVANQLYCNYQKALDEARNHLSSWLNSQVLQYFFSRVSMDDERRSFWEKYAPRMENIRVAIYVEFGLYGGQRLSGEIDSWLKSRLIKVEKHTTDIALVMEYGDWIIVELGTHGNACYLYSKSNRNLGIQSNSIKSLADLKQTHLQTLNHYSISGEGRFIHQEGWQSNLRNLLKRKLGLTL